MGAEADAAAIIVRLKGLPSSARSVDVRSFFGGLCIPEGGVHIIGGPEGDCFIVFASDEDARLAFERTSQKTMHGAEMRMSLSSRTEMNEFVTIARTIAARPIAVSSVPVTIPIHAPRPASPPVFARGYEASFATPKTIPNTADTDDSQKYASYVASSAAAINGTAIDQRNESRYHPPSHTYQQDTYSPNSHDPRFPPAAGYPHDDRRESRPAYTDRDNYERYRREPSPPAYARQPVPEFRDSRDFPPRDSYRNYPAVPPDPSFPGETWKRREPSPPPMPFNRQAPLGPGGLQWPPGYKAPAVRPPSPTRAPGNFGVQYIEILRIPNELLRPAALEDWIHPSVPLKLSSVKVVFDHAGVHLSTFVRLENPADANSLLARNNEMGIRVRRATQQDFEDASDGFTPDARAAPSRFSRVPLLSRRRRSRSPPRRRRSRERDRGRRGRRGGRLRSRSPIRTQSPPRHRRMDSRSPSPYRPSEDDDPTRYFIRISNMPFKCKDYEVKDYLGVQCMYARRTALEDGNASDRWVIEFRTRQDRDECMLKDRSVFLGRRIRLKIVGSTEATRYLQIPDRFGEKRALEYNLQALSEQGLSAEAPDPKKFGALSAPPTLNAVQQVPGNIAASMLPTPKTAAIIANNGNGVSHPLQEISPPPSIAPYMPRGAFRGAGGPVFRGRGRPMNYSPYNDDDAPHGAWLFSGSGHGHFSSKQTSHIPTPNSNEILFVIVSKVPRGTKDIDLMRFFDIPLSLMARIRWLSPETVKLPTCDARQAEAVLRRDGALFSGSKLCVRMNETSSPAKAEPKTEPKSEPVAPALAAPAKSSPEAEKTYKIEPAEPLSPKDDVEAAKSLGPVNTVVSCIGFHNKINFEDLRRFFKDYPIESSKTLLRMSDKDVPTGSVLVALSNEREAGIAASRLNNRFFQGRRITVTRLAS